MAQSGVQLDSEILLCSLCLDLLKDPVATSCGHSYCRTCLQQHWDAEEKEKSVCSCPQCRKTFTARPILERNMLVALVENLEMTGPQTAPADDYNAGDEDVLCDVCTGRKLKALKSCLVCRASYCDSHLQPHLKSSKLKKHKLVEAKQQPRRRPSKSKKHKKVEATPQPHENMCPHHNEVIEIFCHTDQQTICHLCSVEEHKGHQTVLAAAERTEKQKELEKTRQKVQQKIQLREKDLKVFQQEVESIEASADKAVKDSEDIFTQISSMLEKRRSEVRQKVRSTQQAEVNRVKDIQKKMEQEMTELKRRDAELEKILHTVDHSQFLRNFSSLSAPSPFLDFTGLVRPLRYFEDMAADMIKLRDEIKELLLDNQSNIIVTMSNIDVLLKVPEPRCRRDFLKYSRQITLDPNTAHNRMLITENNRKMTFMPEVQSYCDHPDRFTHWQQVLSKERLTGRCYWEFERRGKVGAAVAYKNIKRSGEAGEGGFGFNDKSWGLYCFIGGYVFHHNNASTVVTGPQASRVGVYLDQRAGVLSFYKVSGTMKLLHRVQASFTQPLHVGFYGYPDSSVELMKV